MFEMDPVGRRLALLRLVKLGLVFLLLWSLIGGVLFAAAALLTVEDVVLAAVAAAIAVMPIAAVELSRTVRAELSRRVRASTAETERNLRVSLRKTYWQLESLQYVLQEVKAKRPLPAARGWAMSPDSLKVLIELLREHQPKLVVETGSGTSTIVTAYILKQLGGGKVVSLEDDEDFGARTQAAVRDHGLSGYADVRIAPLVRHEIDGRDWPWYDKGSWEDLGKVDFLTVDGPAGSVSKLARWPAVPLLMAHLKPDAVILLDDVIRPDERQIAEDWHEMLTGSSLHAVETEKGLLVISRKPRRFGISI
jgi:predicted O-methyltransferase YrrM